MFPIPSTEKLIETKICKECQTTFPITDKDIEFYDKVSPVFNLQKFSIPIPTFCPDCRQQRRLAFRNERKLYKRKCGATGKEIISVYSPHKSYKVFNNDYWWSDAWNPLNYGVDFNFSRSFFEQFNELLLLIPKAADFIMNCENCDFNIIMKNSKNCYMCVWTSNSSDSFFLDSSGKSENCADGYNVFFSQHCYEIISSSNCHNSFYINSCSNISDSYFLFHCKGCLDCFCCSNLSNKSFCIFNKQLSKEDYFFQLSKLLPLTQNGIKKYFDILAQISIVPNIQDFELANMEVNNCIASYGLVRANNFRYCQFSGIWSDCMDSTKSWWVMDLTYEVVWVTGVSNIIACTSLFQSNNGFYLDNCHNSTHLFGCIGLRNKQYCILNKQYTREEYEVLVPKIIEKMIVDGEWWEFFPASLSPFGYNETVANEYFPLNKEEALKLWFNWSDYESPFPKVEKIIPASKLPDDITKIPDDILNWAIECEITGKPFRIIKQELEFYRKHNLPIPRRHPDQRHLDRMSLRNPRKLFERTCDKCHKDILTTYAPERPEIVYCEECYNREIV